MLERLKSEDWILESGGLSHHLCPCFLYCFHTFSSACHLWVPSTALLEARSVRKSAESTWVCRHVVQCWISWAQTASFGHDARVSHNSLWNSSDRVKNQLRESRHVHSFSLVMSENRSPCCLAWDGCSSALSSSPLPDNGQGEPHFSVTKPVMVSQPIQHQSLFLGSFV